MKKPHGRIQQAPAPVPVDKSKSRLPTPAQEKAPEPSPQPAAAKPKLSAWELRERAKNAAPSKKQIINVPPTPLSPASKMKEDKYIEKWVERDADLPDDLEPFCRKLMAVVYADEDHFDPETMLRRTPLPELARYLKGQYWYKVHSNQIDENAVDHVKPVEKKQTSLGDMLGKRLASIGAPPHAVRGSPHQLAAGAPDGTSKTLSPKPAKLDPNKTAMWGKTKTQLVAAQNNSSVGEEGGEGAQSQSPSAIDDDEDQQPAKDGDDSITNDVGEQQEEPSKQANVTGDVSEGNESSPSTENAGPRDQSNLRTGDQAVGDNNSRGNDDQEAIGHASSVVDGDGNTSDGNSAPEAQIQSDDDKSDIETQEVEVQDDGDLGDEVDQEIIEEDVDIDAIESEEIVEDEVLDEDIVDEMDVDGDTMEDEDVVVDEDSDDYIMEEEVVMEEDVIEDDDDEYFEDEIIEVDEDASRRQSL